MSKIGNHEMFIYSLPFSQNINDTVMKSTQAASEIKPILQHTYTNKFNRKLKTMGKNTAISSKKKSSKPWWIYPYSVEWKKYMQRLKMPQKFLQQQKKLLNKQIMSPTFHLINNQNKNVDLSDSDMEIIKITTVVEAIRQKRQNSAQMLKTTNNIQKIIGNKRSKRSSSKSRNNSQPARQEKTIVSNKKSHNSNPNYRKQRKRTLPMKKPLRNENSTDLKTANNVAIPSTVFYKRIWEYINGTRPHTDIISGYNSLENNSDNSTCTDKDRVTVSQSQEDKTQVTNTNIKPERDFYKRIWDIINATQLIRNTNSRSKRNTSTPKNNAVSTPCIQEETVNYKEDKQVQATINEKTPLNITGTLSEISDSGPYISGFWNIANKIQWQPKTIPVVSLAKLNNNPILSSPVTSASEVDDLNKFPDKVISIDYSSIDNSTEYTTEMRNSSQEIISEPGPPYSSEESSTTSLFLPIESAVEKPLQETDQVERAENSTGTIPNYDPLNIPYVEVPDYSDQQEKSLDKNNQNTTSARYKEYDDSDYDYIPKQFHDTDDFSSNSPSAKIKVIQTESDGPKTSLNANSTRPSCTESNDSAECVDNDNIEDTKLHNNTENITDDIHRPAEEEDKSSDFIDFDEYKKSINWEEFFKNDPILENIRAMFSKKYDQKEKPDDTEKSEEVETYATDPKKQSHNYFTKNEDFHDDYSFNNRDKTKEETDSHEQKEAKESEVIDKDYYPYDDEDFFKDMFEKDSDKESEYNYKGNIDRTKDSEEIETHTTDSEENKGNSDRTEEFEEIKDPKEQSQDYFVKNVDHHNNHRIASDDADKANSKEEDTDSSAEKEEKQSEEIDEDSYSYYDKDFFKNIFEKDDDKESSDAVDTEKDFLSRYFTKNVLHQLKDNSTIEEDRQREESRNREDIYNTLSKILDKKDRFSRLNENLNKMIEKGEAVPIKYNNFWSLEYESPRKRNKDNEQETEDSKEEA